jgi:type II secretory pathway pseudopilin PulG
MIRKADGFALIDLIFVCGLIGLLASIAAPRFMLAKQSAGAASAIGSMRAVSSAELTYALTCGSGFYAPSLSVLGTAPAGSQDGFIGGGLGVADIVTKSGYVVQVDAAPFAGAPGTCNDLGPGLTGQGFRAAADAVGASNPRFFAVNARGLIFEHSSSLFAAMPEVTDPLIGLPIQ